MKKHHPTCRRVGLLFVSLFTVSCETKNEVREYPTPIEHVIFISKENRTFDTYFGAYTSPSGDPVEGATKGKMGAVTIDLPSGQDVGPYVMHEHSNALLSWIGGGVRTSSPSG